MDTSSRSKVSLKIGQMEFSCEGSEEWVAERMALVFSEAGKLAKIAPPTNSSQSTAGNGTAASEEGPVGALATHLKEKSAEKSQNLRFLATSDWIRRKGKPVMSTSDVTGALKDNHQSRLGNAAECLSQNIKKGFCQKDGKGFFITPEGLKELGYEA